MQLLPKDSELIFPHVLVIPASAGSGKTHTLSHRYVQFLLSQKIPANNLRNILAVTFTKLAAKEMKERILTVLKRAVLQEQNAIQELSQIVAASHNEIAERAEQLVHTILHNYSDFNVRTIDSFLTTVFKSSSIELGVQPNFDLEFDNTIVVEEAFRQFSQNLREGTADSKFIDDLISLIESNDYSSSGFLWNPFAKIGREILQLHKHLIKFASEPTLLDGEKELQQLTEKIISQAKKLQKALENTTLPVNSFFAKDIANLANGKVFEIATKSKKTKYFNKFSDDAGAAKELKKLFSIIRPLEDALEKYVIVYAVTYYQPYVRAVRLIEQKIKDVQLISGSLMLDDINRSLAKYLSNEVVPEVYLKLGERISHFMIDEFQDTSPIQWRNLHPLIEEALAKQGSLFVVGDTKQSIYSFRGADWKIFRDIAEQKYFPSAPAKVISLTTNYRSSQALVDFVKDVFSENVVAANLEKYAAASGLYNFAQDVLPNEKNKGYVEVHRIEKTKDGESENNLREYIITTIRDCESRGYSFGNIAILTQTNSEVVEISSWLNGEQIPFLSLSTLDIRKRKIVGEILSLLSFLDSPIDNLSFTTFILGEIFQHNNPELKEETLHSFVVECQKNNFESYYRAFRRNFKTEWEKYFDRLFALVGYMPLYDLVSEIYKTFSVFQFFAEEESALIKLLECVKQFENTGDNSVRNFLSFSGEEGSDPWSIDVPQTVQTVRIMTVHKAKGLGFPVVITILKERKTKANSLFIEENENVLSILRITKSFGERSEHLAREYQEREDANTIDELNKIYVALTRARKEMYVAVVYSKEENLPASILPQKTYGTKYSVAEKEKSEVSLPRIQPLYRKEKSTFIAATYQKIGLEEIHRGEIIHAILSQIEFLSDEIVGDIAAAIQHANCVNEIDDAEKERLLQFFAVPDIKKYFLRQPMRKILREEDFVSSTGRLYRMDRVVIDADTVTVVDFKTGNDEKHSEYTEQVKNYMTMLSEIFSQKKICGALLYYDLRKGVEVV